MERLTKLIIGLGNNGRKYENTFHNVGHLFADHTSQPQQILKNSGYMNNAGSFVAGALKKRGIQPHELLLAHDDSDLLLGEYKISFGQGSAGHKGVKSVEEALKTNKLWRVRIGIRKSPNFLQKTFKIRPKARSFVLKTISKSDRSILNSVFAEIDAELQS